MAVTCCLALKGQGQPQLELLVHIALFFLLNWLICWMKSEVYIYGDEERYSFSDFVAWLARGPKCSEFRVRAVLCLFSAASSATDSKLTGSFSLCRRGDPFVLEENTFRTETEGNKFQGDTEGECLFPFLPLTKVAYLLLWNTLCLFGAIFTTLWAKLLTLAAEYQV